MLHHIQAHLILLLLLLNRPNKQYEVGLLEFLLFLNFFWMNDDFSLHLKIYGTNTQKNQWIGKNEWNTVITIIIKMNSRMYHVILETKNTDS